MSTGAFSLGVSLETPSSQSFNSRFIKLMHTSQLRAHQKCSDYARWTASLGHRRDTDPRLCYILVYPNLLHETFPSRMLHGPQHQLDLLHRDSVGMLPPLPTICSQLGSVHSRNMRRPKVLGSVYWSFQLSHGCHNRCVTDARPMGPSNAGGKKGRFKRHVFHRYRVRIFSLLFCFSMLEVRSGCHVTNRCYSICIITLVRIKITTDITPDDSAGQYALIALLTCLEASLGVVNACLPVTKPVFDKLKPSSLISALSGRTSIKRSVPSGGYEMPSKPKQVGWPLGNSPEESMQQNSRNSTRSPEKVI